MQLGMVTMPDKPNPTTNAATGFHPPMHIIVHPLMHIIDPNDGITA
jgi:hypothetical protein